MTRLASHRVRDALRRIRKVRAMDNEKRAFDSAGFFDLVGQVMPRHNTGVVSLRIHIRDGLPWAVSVDFDGAKEKAA